MTGKSTMNARDTIQADKLLKLVATGHSVAAACRALGITARRGERLYHRELKRYFDENAGLRSELVARELKTLDMLQQIAMRQALDGELKAHDRVLAIMDRRAKYLDLHAAARVTVEVSLVDDAIKEIVNIIDGEVIGSDDLLHALPVSA